MKGSWQTWVACAVVAVTASCAVFGQSVHPFVVMGDASGDGTLTVADATLVLQFAVGLRTPTPAQEAALPWRVDDTTHYRQVSVADALLVLRVVLGMDRFPVVDKPVSAGEASFEWEALRSELPVLVDFYAPWCGWCQKLDPVIKEIAHDYAGLLRVVKVNVDENKTLTSQYNVRSIPTMILVKSGQVADRTVGYAEKEELSQWLEKRLY